MGDRPHNAPADFDLTGDNAGATTTALSADTPVQDDAPSPRLRERRNVDGHADAVRSARDVVEAHLEQGRHGTVERDLAENFHPDVVVLSRWGIHRGHAGMRELADKLRSELSDMDVSYDEVLVDGDVGFLEWQARGADGSHVCDGADSYVVRNGKIAAQTVHYIVHSPDRQNES